MRHAARHPLRHRIACAFRAAAALFVLAALLAPVAAAGAVLADDLRDLADGATGLADNPDTPGPDLYAPIPWGDDIPDMPSLVALDVPISAAPFVGGVPVSTPVPELAASAPRMAREARVTSRGPPAA